MAVETYQYDQDFYPRPPRGGRLLVKSSNYWNPDISIHALREEGDTLTSTSLPSTTHFYPRPPRGGRHSSIYFGTFRHRFLSTPSARRATKVLGDK